MRQRKFITNGIEYYYTSGDGLITVYQQTNNELIASAELVRKYDQVFINYYENNQPLHDFDVVFSWEHYIKEFPQPGQIQTWLVATHPTQ